MQEPFQISSPLDQYKILQPLNSQARRPQIVLEIVGKTVEYSNIFMFISFHNKKILPIGRTKTVDIQMKDQLYQDHAALSYNESQKRFYINDNNRKFGTFVYMDKNMLVNPHQNHLSFQISGQLFSFEALRSGTPFKKYIYEQRYLAVQKASEDVIASDTSQGEQEPEQLEHEISSSEEEDINQEVLLAKNVSNFTKCRQLFNF